MTLTWKEYYDGLTEIEKPIADIYVGIVANYKPKEALEVGSGWGIFAYAVLSASVDLKLTSIDKIPIEGRPDFNARTAGLEDRIERIVADSMLMLPEMVNEGRKFDMAFIDAAHGYENCLEDLRNSWKLLRDGGVMLVDDVFHRNNYKMNDDLEMDYGVGHALWDFCLENKSSIGRNFNIYPVGHGLAVIEKLT